MRREMLYLLGKNGILRLCEMPRNYNYNYRSSTAWRGQPFEITRVTELQPLIIPAWIPASERDLRTELYHGVGGQAVITRSTVGLPAHPAKQAGLPGWQGTRPIRDIGARYKERGQHWLHLNAQSPHA